MSLENFKIENCNWDFVCTAKWEELNESPGHDHAKVRFCGECRKNVFLTTGIQDLRVNIEENRCVAIPTDMNSLTDVQGFSSFPMTLGMLTQNPNFIKPKA